MTTPTIFADVAGTADNKFTAKSEPQGVLAQRAVATIPATTAAGTNIGMIRFEKGFALTGLAIVSEDLDTLTNVVLDVGYLYDGTTGEDPDAFFNNLDIAQDAGSRVWPTDDGLLTGTSFVATGPGYINVQTGGGATTTAGDITLIAQFTYDLTTAD